MKHLMIAAIFVSLSLSSFAQKTPTLKAETPVRKSSVVANIYPRITLNDSKCRFDHLTLKPAANNEYALTIFFARPCDEKRSFVLTFSDLHEAILVKNLVLNEEDYDFFHLFDGDDQKTTFEIVYPSGSN